MRKEPTTTGEIDREIFYIEWARNLLDEVAQAYYYNQTYDPFPDFRYSGTFMPNGDIIVTVSWYADFGYFTKLKSGKIITEIDIKQPPSQYEEAFKLDFKKYCEFYNLTSDDDIVHAKMRW